MMRILTKRMVSTHYFQQTVDFNLAIDDNALARIQDVVGKQVLVDKVGVSNKMIGGDGRIYVSTSQFEGPERYYEVGGTKAEKIRQILAETTKAE